jgi:hypothetical protein
MFEGVRLMRPAMPFLLGSIVRHTFAFVVGARPLGRAVQITRA